MIGEVPTRGGGSTPEEPVIGSGEAETAPKQEEVPVPEAKGQEIDFGAKEQEIENRFGIRIKKCAEVRDEAFGPGETGQRVFVRVLKSAKEKNEINEKNREGTGRLILTPEEELAISLNAKQEEVVKERAEETRILNEQKAQAIHKDRMEKIGEI